MNRPDCIYPDSSESGALNTPSGTILQNDNDFIITKLEQAYCERNTAVIKPKLEEDSVVNILNQQPIHGTANLSVNLLNETTRDVTVIDSSADVTSFLLDSIYHTDLLAKHVCRVAEVIGKLSSSQQMIFSSDNLFAIVNHIDTIYSRDHLYENNLRTNCDLLIPRELSIGQPWELLLDPIKRYKVSFVHILHPLILVGLKIYMILLIKNKVESSGSGVDLPALLSQLHYCGLHDVESVVATFIRTSNLLS